MQLASLLSPELIFLGHSYADKDEMIDELLAGVFRKRYKITASAEDVKAAVYDRESLGGTVFPSGLAMPHARLDNFNDILLVIGVPEAPVVFGDIPIRLMVLVLMGHETSTMYLSTLSAFAKLSTDAEYFGRLLASSSPQKFIQTFKERKLEAKKEILADSIMSRDFHTLHPDNTIKDAIDFLYRHRTGFIPILEDNVFVGELSVFDIFALSIPNYAKQIGSLKFMKSFEVFETLLNRENALKIRDVMRRDTDTLDEDSPLIEVVMKISRGRKRNIPVLRGGKELVGIINFMDIIHKVIRA